MLQQSEVAVAVDLLLVGTSFVQKMTFAFVEPEQVKSVTLQQVLVPLREMASSLALEPQVTAVAEVVAVVAPRQAQPVLMVLRLQKVVIQVRAQEVRVYENPIKANNTSQNTKKNSKTKKRRSTLTTNQTHHPHQDSHFQTAFQSFPRLPRSLKWASPPPGPKS